MVEKLSKALEGLKNIQFNTGIEDTALRKKKKMLSCALVADLMVSLRFTDAQNLPQLISIVVESLIHLCDDKDSDVRMVADESLNRIIRALTETNMLKIQVELHKEIKKNGSPRCLRGALWRFGQLSCYIRPSKGKGHVQNLIPCIIQICKREEESVHETLAVFIENTFKVIGVFIQDNDTKSLLEAFFNNLSSKNVVIRRTAASCINSTIKYCRKQHVFNSIVLNMLLDCVIPVSEDKSTSLVLGVLGCLRLLLPNLNWDRNDEGISGSFGLRWKKDETLLSTDRLIQIYELCLHYSKSRDHNVVIASLETLHQLLQNMPQQLETLLLSSSGFSRSFIHSSREDSVRNRSQSELSIASSSAADAMSLLDDSDLTSFHHRHSLSGSRDASSSEQSSSRAKTKFIFPGKEAKMMDSPFKDVLLGELFEDRLSLGNDSDTESSAPSEINASAFLVGAADADINESLASKDVSWSNSRDDLHSVIEGETLGDETNIDIGAFTDQDVSLNFCARHLAASFLLDGTADALKSDRNVRVSIKSLALSCISAIAKLRPKILDMDLAKTNHQVYNQRMSDVLLFSDHSDPQIRGNVSVLVASLVHSVLIESKGFECEWINEGNSRLNFARLFDILFKGLKDESSICTRQALSGVGTCLKTVLFSTYREKSFPILRYLPSLTRSSYWLLKVKLAEVLNDIPYVCLCDFKTPNPYQEEVIENVLFSLLGDEDPRVRSAAAESLSKIIPRLSHGSCPVLNFSKTFPARLKKCLKSTKDNFAPFDGYRPFPPFSHAAAKDGADFDFEPGIEGSLSRIITKLTHSLLVAVNKYFILGCLEALKSLSQRYPPTVYLHGWNCATAKGENDGEGASLPSNLLPTVLSLLITSPVVLDLTAFNNATAVLGSLFAGHCICNLKCNYQVTVPSPTDEAVNYWNILKNEQLSALAEQIFVHIMKVLNIYSNLLEEVPLSKATVSATAATNLLPISLASPIKKQERKPDREDRAEERKAKSSGSKQSPQYARLQQLLKNAYNNYKISLDSSVGEKFLALLETTINVLCTLLEIATVYDTGRCAEEILSYLRSSVSLCASPSVLCVIQLLKSLFGTNLASNAKDGFKTDTKRDGFGGTLFANIYQLPSEWLYSRISSHSTSSLLECDNLSGARRRMDRKVIVQRANKDCLSTYVRLVEPMVIKSLQLYTVTNDVVLQSNILKLLNQMIQLRVNYCLLDPDEIFIGFVLKQFELVENGQILGIEKLLPDVFHFLVLLSYEKHHSKTIMNVPKIFQLCDGLMASNQSTQTHCIPALVPIVEDVFLSRNLISSSAEQKELETQREVVLAMLLRLVEFHEVMNMLIMILNECRTVEERERWKRLSRQVMDAVLPLASQDKLRTEAFEGQESFNRLMSSLSPNVLRPIDPLLKILFVEPNDYSCWTSLKRWLARVTVVTETILHVKEDVLLCRLEEVSPNVNLSDFFPPKKSHFTDPFNVVSSFPTFDSSETFARFLFKVIAVAGYKIRESVSTSRHFQRQLSLFFLCVFHILKSGTFHRITNSLQNLLATERDAISSVSSVFVSLMHFAPMLTCQFTYFLALLNYFERGYWTAILRGRGTLPSELVQHCGVISLCDYLCEILSDTDTLQFLLSNNLQQVIMLSNESPVKDLMTTIHRRAESILLLEAISSKCLDSRDPRLLEKLLRILEIANNSHSGYLLSLLVKRFITTPYVGLSRLAGLLACRRAEFLLTLSSEQARQHMDKQGFLDLCRFINNRKVTKRHYTLVGLLNKLGVEVYDEPSAVATGRSQATEPRQPSKSVRVDESWYFSQVKARCCQESRVSGCEIAQMLSSLKYGRIIDIMTCPRFNVDIVRDCLVYLDLARRNSHVRGVREPKHVSSNESLKEASAWFIFRCTRDSVQRLKGILGGFDEGERNAGDCDSFTNFTQNENDSFPSKMWQLAECLTLLIDSEFEIGDEHVESVAEFGLSCLRVINRSMREERHGDGSTSNRQQGRGASQEVLERGLACCSAVIKHRKVRQWISRAANGSKLRALVRDAHFLAKHFLPETEVRVGGGGGKEFFKKNYAYDELMLLEELHVLATRREFDSVLPSHLSRAIRELIASTCRIPELSAHILKVPEQPVVVQDLESLENFISVFSTVTWTNRQQFEEIWMALLTVLGFNNGQTCNMPPEESAFVLQASAMAIEGITTLLKNTMINADTNEVIHHGRDSLDMKNVPPFPVILKRDSREELLERSHHILHNLELSKLTDRYHHGLLSVEYIWTALKQIDNHIEIYEKHSSYVNAIGLDVTSCIHLLMELYNQWIYQFSPDIRIITSCLKSAIVISDLFTDVSQFQWLLDFCFRIERLAISDNVVILPLVIVGCCKAASITLPDIEMCEKIKRLMLHSRSVPCRVAAIQGLLYLLQTPVLTSAARHARGKAKASASDADDFSSATNITDMFLPVAMDVVQEFRQNALPAIEEYERNAWSLLFYLLHRYQSHLRDAKEDMLNFVLAALSKRSTCSDSVATTLVRGIGRLLLAGVLDDAHADRFVKMALDMTADASVAKSRCGLQLLLVFSFSAKRLPPSSVAGQDDPEKIMRDKEKVNVLFEKLRKSYPEEAEIVADVISYVLMDFTASDVLTKVIQEFLSSQQPHLKKLSGLVFKVFERADATLLEDWVVFSLPSFTQGLPVAMSIWTLNCFFVSASNEAWLRSMFPLVQARARMAEEEDRKLLCLSASLFYRQLKDEEQKKLFRKTFENASKTHKIFSELLASL